MSKPGHVWNSTLKRKTPLRAKKPFRSKPKPLQRGASRMTRSKGLGKGKKTKQWDADRAKLKKLFAAAGITVCEVQEKGCFGDNYLGFAHSKKRRNVVTLEDRFEVCLACNSCHDKIENTPERVLEVIASRRVKIA